MSVCVCKIVWWLCGLVCESESVYARAGVLVYG